MLDDPSPVGRRTRNTADDELIADVLGRTRNYWPSVLFRFLQEHLIAIPSVVDYGLVVEQCGEFDGGSPRQRPFMSVDEAMSVHTHTPSGEVYSFRC